MRGEEAALERTVVVNLPSVRPAHILEAVLQLLAGEPVELELEGQVVRVDPEGKAVFLVAEDLLAEEEVRQGLDYKLYLDMPDDMRCARSLQATLLQQDLLGSLKQYIEHDRKRIEQQMLLKKHASLLVPVSVDEGLNIVLEHTQSLKLVRAEVTQLLGL
jgi:hypothetical protein